MSIKIKKILQQISLSIKIQEFPEQNLEIKQDPSMEGSLDFGQDSRQYFYLKEYQFK